jgi:hypothetical protein
LSIPWKSWIIHGSDGGGDFKNLAKIQSQPQSTPLFVVSINIPNINLKSDILIHSWRVP